MLWPSRGPHSTIVTGKPQDWAQDPPAALTLMQEAGKALQARLHSVPARKGMEQPWGASHAWGPWGQLPAQCPLPVLLLCLPCTLCRLGNGETEARSCAQRAAPVPVGAPLRDPAPAQLSGAGGARWGVPPRPRRPTDGGSLTGPGPARDPAGGAPRPPVAAAGARDRGGPWEGRAGPRWAALGCAGSCGAGLGSSVLGCAGPCWATLGCTGLC